MNKILQSTGEVMAITKHVTIDNDALLKFAENFEHEHVKHWLHAAPFDFGSLSEDELLSFLLVFNSISFCYWSEPKWTVEYKGKSYDGAWGMMIAIRRAIDEGYPILDASFRATLTQEDFLHILRANIEIPLCIKRYTITKNIAETLVNKYDGNFGNFIQAQAKDAQSILEKIVQEFPSFEDVSEYDGKKVYFYKRAQLLVSDIYQMFGGKGYGEFSGIETITACADYKLPQALRKFGILIYNKSLVGKIDTKMELHHNSEEEIEIRAATIQAIEEIKREVKKRIPEITSMDINDHIWLYTQTKYPDDMPYHRSLTTCY